MGLVADDAEWMRFLQDAFASTFEPLTTVFAAVIALCNPYSPVVLWERNVENIVADLRRRYAAVPEALTLLQADEEAQKYAMHEVQGALKDLNDRLNVEDFGLTKPDNDIRILP